MNNWLLVTVALCSIPSSALADDTLKFREVPDCDADYVKGSGAIPLFYDNLTLSDDSVLRFVDQALLLAIKRRSRGHSPSLMVLASSSP
jgi:hypothetical protein